MRMPRDGGSVTDIGRRCAGAEARWRFSIERSGRSGTAARSDREGAETDRQNAPIFGICLGNRILGLALGGKTYKLKFGHRGANHPVMNQLTQRVEITSHNHGFAVDPDSLNANDVEITHVNLNDQTLEGFRHRRERVFCVQCHPEAAPGPHDSHYLFDDFVKLMADKWADTDAAQNDLHRILIVGSGPIVIGQACEFDYSGTQAYKALHGGWL